MQPKKKVTAEVSHAVWKELKVLAVQKEVSLQLVISDILERSMQKKIKNSMSEVAEVTE
jgi:macrodomain Ter protein organizer (MatP/YcbG family)